MQWDSSLDGEVVFEPHSESVWIRVVSGTAISGLEFHGHVVEQIDCRGSLKIVHSWQDDDGAHESTSPGKTSYAVTCGPNPHSHTIEMRVPSGQ